ncbi:hypothetical protein [Maridesulfovibrio frigidus]|uniref:hypothetical protein n=1 Tax=Maridesulfovibrio frigidus TaxID=340956 RepID=UPI0004E14FC2|nr:hypothetical protein [Maridesulfovibrio frigidus]
MRNTTLGLVALPAAIGAVGVLGTTATGVAFGRTVASAGGAVLKDGKAVVRGVSKAGKKILKQSKKKYLHKSIEADGKLNTTKAGDTFGTQNIYDYVSSLNPSTLPATSKGGAAAVATVELVKYGHKKYKEAKAKD